MCNIIYVKSIHNDVTHLKIFTLSKLLVIFYTLKSYEVLEKFFACDLSQILKKAYLQLLKKPSTNFLLVQFLKY